MDVNETLCKNPSCRRKVEQVSGSHRKREYCDDNCRQAAHRARQEAYRRQQCIAQVQTWGSFIPETVSLLAELLYAGSEEFAQRLAAIVRSEQGQNAGQVDQNIAAYQEKLAQAAQRIEKLERQVDIQRQKLGHYYQRFYPSSLAVAEERLLALGAAVNYRRLLKYNELTVEIAAGADAWREFAKAVDYDTLALAIQQAQRFLENLEAVHAVTKRDSQAKND